MLLELAIMAAIQSSNPMLPMETVNQYAKIVLEETTSKKLDLWVFLAVIKTESQWHPKALNKSRAGCAVGLGQILVRCRKNKIDPLYDPANNLRRSAEMQAGFVAWCQTHACRWGWLYLYNPSEKYVGIVMKTAEEIRHEYVREAAESE